MRTILGIYASTVNAHMPKPMCDADSMGKTIKMPDLRTPQSGSRRALTRSDETFARNVARLMKEHGAINNNQSELGRRSKVDQAYISKLLKGMTSISVAYLDKIAAALGVEPWCLLVEGEWSLSNPPVLQPISEAEKRLYEKMQEVRCIAVEIAKEKSP